MDWSDDVAYSVHDIEDAVHSGLVDLTELRSPQVQGELIEIARERFDPSRDANALLEALQRLTALDCWPGDFDGSMASLVALKRLTSQLIGRFCTAAQDATRARYGPDPLCRYQADLVVPDAVRDEVSVMKAVAVHYVMRREGAEREYARQREIIAELVHALRLDGGRSLEPWLRPSYLAATSDAERFRVVIDQVASLTDVSVLAWHQRFC